MWSLITLTISGWLLLNFRYFHCVCVFMFYSMGRSCGMWNVVNYWAKGLLALRSAFSEMTKQTWEFFMWQHLLLWLLVRILLISWCNQQTLFLEIIFLSQTLTFHSIPLHMVLMSLHLNWSIDCCLFILVMLLPIYSGCLDVIFMIYLSNCLSFLFLDGDSWCYLGPCK